MTRFQGTNSARLCSLAGRYDNPISTRFIAPIDCLKIPAQICQFKNGGGERITKFCSLVVLSGREKAQAFRPNVNPGSPLSKKSHPSVLKYWLMTFCKKTTPSLAITRDKHGGYRAKSRLTNNCPKQKVSLIPA